MLPLDEAFATYLLPQLSGWLVDRKLMPLLQRDREMLEYFDKIFQLSVQLAAAANNLGVLGVSLA